MAGNLLTPNRGNRHRRALLMPLLGALALRSSRRCPACSGLEVARPVDIGNQPRLLRLPAEAFPSPPAGPRNVSRDKMREPAEMFARFLESLGDDRNVQTATDHSGNVPKRY